MVQRLTIKDCELIVKKKLNTDDVSKVHFTLKPLFGQNFELKINFQHAEEAKTLLFFAKTTSSVPMINDILDKFENALPNFKTDLTPKVYHVKDDFVVFEHVQNPGFQTCESLKQEHLFAALKVLAKFHAASLSFEETKSKSAKYRLDQEYALINLNFSLREPTVSGLVSTALENQEDLPKVIEELEGRQFRSKFRNSLCHGSLIPKNLLFKSEKTAPLDCKLINIKANFYAPPVYDVLQLIFFNTSAELRQRLWKTLLDRYYDYLKEEAKTHGVNIDNIISTDDFHLSAHHFLPLIKIEAAILHQDAMSIEELKDILTCPLLSREDCYTIVENKLSTTDYKFLSFKVTPLSDVSGFLGQYHRVQIKILLGEETDVNCFIKSTPRVGIPMDIAKDLNSFPREVFMYETVVAQMLKLGINTIKECIPPLYFYRPDEFMVFEDMALLGYQNLDSMKPLDLATLTLLIKTVAKFHASSIILEEKLTKERGKPYRLIDHYSEHFTEPLFFEDDKHRGARQTTNGIKSILIAVDLLTEIQTETNQRNFREFWPKFKEVYYAMCRPSDRFRNILCHGDLWTSNMMVKYKDDQPVSCALFDFQIVRYCPPVYDLLSVLYLTTHRSTRQKYEEQILRVYYDELRQILGPYGVSLEDIYSYDEFIECFNCIRPHMLMHAAYECVLTMSTPEEISSFMSDDEKCNQLFFEDRRDFMTFMCGKSAVYRKRLTECILDIYDYCDSMCSK